MRILFTTLPYVGHFHPLAPIARAAMSAGHEVAVACAPSFAPVVEQAGLRTLPAGFDPRGRPVHQLFPGFARQSPEREIYWTIPTVFVGVYATALVPDLWALCRDWRPDVIVRESCEYGGAVAAELLELPHASVRSDSVSASYGLREHVAPALATLRDLNGLPPDPDAAMPFRYLHLACEPPGFALAREAPAPTVHYLRPAAADDDPVAAPPGWAGTLPAGRTVYATLGTNFGNGPRGHALFRAILDAFHAEPLALVLTVGRRIDPAEFGPQPAHVHIERYIPQALLLPLCDLVLNHGGFSTIAGALSAGRAMVFTPLGSDQYYNAECCAALGVGRMLEPHGYDPTAIRAAVRDAFSDSTFRRNAERVRGEIAALPGPEHAVGLLERLAREKRPIPTAG